MDLTLSYELSLEDYIDAQITYNKSSDTVQKNIKKTRINLLSLYAFLILILYHAFTGITRIVVLGVLFIGGVCHILFVPKLHELRTRNTARKVLSKLKEEIIHEKKRVKVEEDTIIYNEKRRTTKIKIEEVLRILESEKNYLIFWQDESPVILPKEYEGEEEIQKGIVRYIREKRGWAAT